LGHEQRMLPEATNPFPPKTNRNNHEIPA